MKHRSWSSLQELHSKLSMTKTRYGEFMSNEKRFRQVSKKIGIILENCGDDSLNVTEQPRHEKMCLMANRKILYGFRNTVSLGVFDWTFRVSRFLL